MTDHFIGYFKIRKGKYHLDVTIPAQFAHKRDWQGGDSVMLYDHDQGGTLIIKLAEVNKRVRHPQKGDVNGVALSTPFLYK